MKEPLNIRTYTWIQGQLSWAYVSGRLCKSFEDLGHNVFAISTNGIKDSDPYFSEEKMIKSVIGLDKLKKQNTPIDLDWCYTVPANFPARFLSNSKHKAAIYNYETWKPGGNGWNPQWKQFYNLVDFYFPSSNFSAEIFYINGIPKEKIFVIPHGVDTKIFNPNIPPVKLNTKKKIKFVSVVAPHYRKNIDTMLEAYCQAFTANDDVCLVLKTKVFKHSDGIHDERTNPKGRKPFEIVLGDIFKNLQKKYGKNIPEIEILNGHVDNVASIYNACDIHITTTGAEGWGMPMHESMSCGLINIMPRYSGQLMFANDNNSLLIDTKLRLAKREEQYWAYNANSMIGQPSVEHTVELMRRAVKEKDQLLEKFRPEMEKVVKEYSWENAAKKIIDVCDGKIEHYKPGTYNLYDEHKR